MKCDLLLLLGTNFPFDKFPCSTKAQDRSSLTSESTIWAGEDKLISGLCGDVGETLRALMPMVEAKQDRTFLNAMLRKTPGGGSAAECLRRSCR